MRHAANPTAPGRIRGSRAPRAAAALAAVAAACSGGGTPDADRPDAMEVAGLVEIGTGTTAWQPLADGAELPIEAGPQGGHHFIVHARARDILPGDPSQPGLADNPLTRFEAWTTGDAPRQVDMGVSEYQVGYEDGGDGYLYLTSGRLLFLTESEVEGLYGQPVRLTVHVRDAAGTASRDAAVVTAVRPPAP
ncbi:MAG: hypothetical protein D6689_21545 [Deltaproteobacteria bacterium]|nr:MAG: hypothetical protein D6689_21545 [Deltaproteobacteria bacterium]